MLKKVDLILGQLVLLFFFPDTSLLQPFKLVEPTNPTWNFEMMVRQIEHHPHSQRWSGFPWANNLKWLCWERILSQIILSSNTNHFFAFGLENGRSSLVVWASVNSLTISSLTWISLWSWWSLLLLLKNLSRIISFLVCSLTSRDSRTLRFYP